MASSLKKSVAAATLFAASQAMNADAAVSSSSTEGVGCVNQIEQNCDLKAVDVPVSISRTAGLYAYESIRNDSAHIPNVEVVVPINWGVGMSGGEAEKYYAQLGFKSFVRHLREQAQLASNSFSEADKAVQQILLVKPTLKSDGSSLLTKGAVCVYVNDHAVTIIEPDFVYPTFQTEEQFKNDMNAFVASLKASVSLKMREQIVSVFRNGYHKMDNEQYSKALASTGTEDSVAVSSGDGKGDSNGGTSETVAMSFPDMSSG